MPRALVALVVTIAAVVLVTSFHASPKRIALTARPSAAPHRAAAAPPGTSGSKVLIPPRSLASPSRTVTGAAVQDPYGTVQVAVTLQGTRILNVRAIAIPLDTSTSYAINSQAAPLLRSEVLRAQSARIDVLSGATVTSDAYAQSLQAALDRIGRG